MAAETPRKNPWLVLMVFSVGLFMTLLDLTIVNIAIPSIVDDLRAPLDGILWMLNAYSLVYAVLLITSARLGDLFGPRTLFVVGVGTFTVASALSGLAQDPTQLILARAAQGLGAALIAPQGLPMITSLFAPEKRSGVFAIFGILAGLAVVLGPTLGGLIVSHLGWRWIFYVNIPIGVALIAAAWALVPDLRLGRSHRLDLVGVALASAGLLLVVYGLIEGQRFDWGTVTGFITIPEIIVAGIVLLVAFMAYERRMQDQEPLLPFAVFRDRNFTLMVFVLMAMGFAMLGVFLPLTIYFQSVLGYDALTAGLTIAPMPLAYGVALVVSASLFLASLSCLRPPGPCPCWPPLGSLVVGRRPPRTRRLRPPPPCDRRSPIAPSTAPICVGYARRPVPSAAVSGSNAAALTRFRVRPCSALPSPSSSSPRSLLAAAPSRYFSQQADSPP